MTYRHLRNVRGFFSDYYLGSVFARGQGRGRKKQLSERETDAAYRRFSSIYRRAEGHCTDAPACRERFIRPLLRDVLGCYLGGGENRVHGLYLSAKEEATGQRPLLLAYCGSWDEDLGAGRGSTSPIGRMETALAGRNLAYGVLVNGERIRLVRAPGDGPRSAFIEADLAGMAEEDDPESFAAFYRLFHISQFQPDDRGVVPLGEVEKESREHAEKVSEDLKRAVFTAAESLTQGLLTDAVSRGTIPRAQDLSENEIKAFRDAALTALYRILFILYAEARDARLEDHEVYHRSYSIHGLIETIVGAPARPWPENMSGTWSRLKALFRIYDKGLPPIHPWQHIPPRGGDFFNTETPEGHILDAARLPDKTVVCVLLDLATTAPHRGVGRERVSFRELDIESLGAVYEGLLEYEPRVAAEETFEIRVQGKTYALVAAEITRLCREKNLQLKGDVDLLGDLPPALLHPVAPAAQADESDEAGDEEEDLESDASDPEDQEDEPGKGLKKGGAARLLRRLLPGTFYFVPGAARKGSGSFYTPLPLVQDIVRYAVGPLVEGREVEEIESLRILDPACGSAHFLVEAMRFMGRELHRAYVRAYDGKPPPAFTRGPWDADWQASDEEARAANSEARAWCKRRIAERCLFGVDLNPTAVNLARVALWIESLAGDRPLTFFEHHVRYGNSLLGTWLDRLDLPPLSSMEKRRPYKGQLGLFREDNLFVAPVREAIRKAAETRKLIPLAADVGALDADSLAEQQFKRHQHETAEKILAAARLLFDLRSASAFVPAIWRDWLSLCQRVGDSEKLQGYAESRSWWNEYKDVRTQERFFHWELEFPEVFFHGESAGFDAVIGNPPWDKVLPTKHEFYSRYDILIRAYNGNELEQRIQELHHAMPDLAGRFKRYGERTRTIAQILRTGGDFPLSEARSQAAHEDVSKYFVDRAARINAPGGNVGMIVPSVLYNGDGCVGIRKYLIEKAAVRRFYAFENRKKIFPIDSRYKFVSLVFNNGEHPADGFDAAFMRHDLDELSDTGTKPWMVYITAAEVRRLSPETFAFLEYRSARDQEIIHKMYHGKPTLGGDGHGSWGTAFISWRAHEGIYNSAEDKDLWSEPGKKRLYTPQSVLGSVPQGMDEILEAMREKGFWPVFEGKHIDQFLVGTKPVRWWLSVEAAEEKYGKRLRKEPMLVFRETASNTNERTCIAAVLPAFSAASHKLSGLLTYKVAENQAAAVLNSFCFDFALRHRTAGTSVSFTYMRPMPIPHADQLESLPELTTIPAWESNIEHITEKPKTWSTLWLSNRTVAEAYGLSADDFEHILASFPVFGRKRPAFFAYLKERLAEWRAESGPEAAGQPVAAAAEELIELPLAAEPQQTYSTVDSSD